MNAPSSLSRRSRLAFPLLCVVTALAALSPMLTAPHEANACSGAGPGPDPKFLREVTPTVENATSTDRDLIVVLTKKEPSVTGPNVLATSAHIEGADGKTIILSRNDLAPGTASYKERRVFVPAAPLDANTDYTFVIEGVVVGADPAGPVSTARLPFKTGDKLHPPPPTPAITGEASRGLQPESQAGSLCCGQSADYVPGGCSGGTSKGTPAACVTTKRTANEEISVAWTQNTGEGGWGAGVAYEGIFASVGYPNAIRQPLSGSLPGPSGDPFPVVLGPGDQTCVTIVAIDRDTGLERSAPQVCYTPSANVAGPRTACEDLVPLMTAPQWKAGCETNDELRALLKDCPGAGMPAGSAGASGGAGTEGTGASPPAASGDDGGCSLGDLARSDGTAALAPLFAALAGVWVARRRRG